VGSRGERPGAYVGGSPLPRRRAANLIRHVVGDAAQRLATRQPVVLFTEGEASSASRFPAIDGQAYRPSRQGHPGRFPKMPSRIPRTLAHGPLVKQREGQRVVAVAMRYAAGSQRCVQHALDYGGYPTPNPSAIERRNGTARRMSAHQVRNALACARRDQTQVALAWGGLTVYNGWRSPPSLRQPCPEPPGKKSARPIAQPGSWG
jgi:hypothetical protein